MILTCPSCSAKFMISSEALGAEGREVRCGKCGHMWFQPGERDSLDELPDVEPDEIDIGFDTRFETPAENPDEKLQPIPEILKPEKTSVFTDDLPAEKKSAGLRPHAAAIVCAGLVIAALFSGFIMARETLGRSVPFLGAAYEKMGFPLKKQDSTIAIDRLRVTRSGAAATGSFYLINLTSDSLPVRKITAELTDFDYKTIKSQDVKPPETSLKGEGQSKVDFTFSAAPKEAVSVRITVAP